MMIVFCINWSVWSLFGNFFDLIFLLLFALKGRLLERMSILLAIGDLCVAKAIWRSFFDTLVIKRRSDFLS